MKEIWSNKEYRERHAPPIIPGWPARYGEKNPNVVFWYLYTPTHRVSKYWWYAWSKIRTHEQVVEKYANTVRGKFKSLLRKGYTISEPYKY